MSTKFVLHGGFDKERGPAQENDAFFAEMLKDTPEDVKILLVYFAVREEKVELRTGQDKGQLNKNNSAKKNLDFKVATAENFIEECGWADVIYLHGGETVKIMEVLKNYKNLEEVFSGKTVAGDSAGVNVLGQLFYSKNTKEIGHGLKILPFKVVVHYVDGEPNPLADVEPNLETLFLGEYEMKVFMLK